MGPDGFCGQARVFIVAGKGGVGKTTVSAALARMAATAGLRTLVVDVEGTGGLAASFGHRGALTYDEVVLAPAGPGGSEEVRARTLTPDDALLEYLDTHGMGRIARKLATTGAIDVVATAAPGIKDILVLGKVKQLERSGAFDLIVVDAPAAGHAVTFLSSACGLLDAVRVGPIRAQAEDVVQLLADAERCQVLLVTMAEETPVNELVETAYKLEDRVGVSLAPVVVNGLYPPVDGLEAGLNGLGGLGGLDTGAVGQAGRAGAHLRPGEAEVLAEAAEFRLSRIALQREQVERLAKALPLPQLQLPFMFTTEVGPTHVDKLAKALAIAVADLPG